MIRYDMILTAIGFPPGGSGGQSCTQIENKLLYACTWGGTIYRTTQKHRTHK